MNSGTRFSSSVSNNSWILIAIGLALSAVFGYLAFLSGKFALELPVAERPILLTISAFGVAFFLYLVSLTYFKRAKDNLQALSIVLTFGVLFRAIMFFSTPIQEVDIYRYVWDGVVVEQGISPFRYAPELIRTTSFDSTDSAELQKLIRIYRQGRGAADALDRVHFGQIPTVYPPVSQAIFGMTSWLCPDNSSLLTRLRVMKLTLVLFDIGTILFVIRILAFLNLPTALSGSYAWCPLVIKEIANSGHLDSIAIFLTTAAVFYLLKLCWSSSTPNKPDVRNSARSGSLTTHITPVLFLALAIGAKLYAIVLAPLFCLIAIKRVGWKTTILTGLVFIIITFICLYPMLPTQLTTHIGRGSEDVVATDPSQGVSVFLKYWEMNDLLFMIVVENLKPTDQAANPKVWFSILPNEYRAWALSTIQTQFETDESITPFLTARAITTTLFVFIAIGLAFWAAARSQPTAIVRAAFLTLAWFWILSPTQNPWYWLWALPFIATTKNKAWHWMSGLLFIYYLRFWLEYHFTGVSVLQSFGLGNDHWLGPIADYQGVHFFDFFVTWLEHGPWLVLLLFGTLKRKSQSRESES